MTKRFKFFILENALLFVLFDIGWIASVATHWHVNNKFLVMMGAEFIYYGFFFFSIIQFLFLNKPSNKKQIACTITTVLKILLFCMLTYLTYSIFNFHGLDAVMAIVLTVVASLCLAVEIVLDVKAVVDIVKKHHSNNTNQADDLSQSELLCQIAPPKKRFKFMLIEHAVLVGCWLIIFVQYFFAKAQNQDFWAHTAWIVLVAFVFFSLAQYVATRNYSIMAKFANAMIVFVKTRICYLLFIAVNFELFTTRCWTPEQWAEIGNFGTEIWSYLLRAGTGIVLIAVTAIELVVVGVDIVGMVKKLAKHIQARRQKA